MAKFDAKAAVMKAQRKKIKKGIYFRKVIDSIQHAVIIVNTEGMVKLFNQTAVDVWGLGEEDLQHSIEDLPLLSPEILDKIQDTFLNRKKNELPECSFNLPSGEEIFLRLDFAPLIDEQDEIEEVIITGTDITRVKQLEKEKKILEGLLPICSNCKKIRDNQQEWVVLEEYMNNHSSAKFTHSICPDCVKKYYPDL